MDPSDVSSTQGDPAEHVSDVAPEAAEDVSDVAPEAPKAATPRWLRPALIIGVPVLVLLVAYVVAAFTLAGQVPRDTHVAGVQLGGLSAAAAEQALEDGLADVAEEPVNLVAGDGQVQIAPADVSLSLDAAATVERLTGFTLNPRIVFGHLFGLGAEPAVSEVDEAALEEAVAAAAADLDVAPVEGAIEVLATGVLPVEPADGFAIDVPATTDRIRTTWLESSPLEAVVDVIGPAVDAAAVQDAMDRIAGPLTSGPISIEAGSAVTEIPVEDLLAVSRVEPEDGELVLRMDGEQLRTRLYALSPEIGVEPMDASIRVENGAPVVVPSVSGAGIDADVLAAAAVDAALDTGDRATSVELEEMVPEFTTADAEALGVVEKVSEFSTPLTSDAQRTQNLVVGAAAIDGTIVLPGETFSLLDALGPITPAAGYNQSGVVIEGVVSKAVGGGLSQLATTTFNAAYFAGMDDVFHQPHSRWFSRYPEGREATIFSPTIDMKWRNNTEHGVLVQSWVASGRTWVAFWSTKVWEVSSVTGARYAFTAPTTVYNTSANCIPEPGGSSGFTVKVTRTRTMAGGEPEQQTWTTRYQPWNEVVCGPPPEPEPETEAEGAEG